MHNSLKKEVICALVQHLSHFMHFWVGTKKTTFLLFLCGFLLILQEKFRLRSLTKVDKMNELLFFLHTTNK